MPAFDGRNRRPMHAWPMARALALRVLDTVRDQHGRKLCAAAVPPGVRRAVKCPEADFADDLSLNQLAAKARMSRGHFALTFRQVTGYALHQYLLLVRPNHARKLIAQGSPASSLARDRRRERFCDQAHLSPAFSALLRHNAGCVSVPARAFLIFRHQDWRS
jgi:transcriptional regulator GlxA family with amidase domain